MHPTPGEHVAFQLLGPEVERMLAETPTLEDAAQGFTRLVHRSSAHQVALARVYVAMPAQRLGPRERAFAESAAGGSIADGTLVLTLLGTSGARPEWNDRSRSRGHVAIPLSSGATVEAIPMVAALLKSIGFSPRDFDSTRDLYARKLPGGFNGVFYVPDARTALDAGGRHIIPAQEFVRQERIVAVAGGGGAYVNGWIVAAVVFLREAVNEDVARQLVALVSELKMGTMKAIASGRIFQRVEAPGTGGGGTGRPGREA